MNIRSKEIAYEVRKHEEVVDGIEEYSTARRLIP